MNILSVFVLFAILLKCVAASGRNVGVAFQRGSERGELCVVECNWGEMEEDRKDLFDYVIAKGVDFTVGFIQNVGNGCVLAALFDKGEGMIDSVFERIKYIDNDLYDLTNYRPELAGSPEKFFRVLDKIKEPERQESAVRLGVENLFKAGKHDLVVPLVNALGKRTFKSDRLKEEAIQTAFWEGAKRGNQDIMEEYYGHPAVTSGRYAGGLKASWNNGEPNQVFSFLLDHADQGDLDMAKKQYEYRKYPECRQAIDEAFKTAPPAGSRIISVEKVQHLLTVSASITGASAGDRPGSSIRDYLLGEKERTNGRRVGDAQEEDTGFDHPL